ncbi:MAG: hypothetical protein AB1420_10990 [Bacillota bacterium]
MREYQHYKGQKPRSIWPIVLAVVISALVTGFAVYWWQTAAMAQERDSFRQTRQELQQKIDNLQSEVDELQGQDDGTVPGQDDVAISRKPKPGWEQYFPTAETTTLTGKSVNEVRELLGEPPVLVRSIAVNPEFNREVWVFHPFDEDPTGLYIFFKGNQLVNSRLDEFPGLRDAYFWGDEEFWNQ